VDVDPGPRDRAKGQYFTPPALAAQVARAVVGCLPKAIRVLDPAAGDGRMLEAVRALCPDAELIGLERDPELAARARKRVRGGVIITCESLFDAPRIAYDVDAVVGNPPYVRSIRLREADPELWRRIKGAFDATSHGEWDLYAAFIERALSFVNRGGRIGLITPSRWWTASFARLLRARVASSVREVIDFGATQLFEGATTYASVTVLEKETRARVVRVSRSTERGWEYGRVASKTLGAAPWRFPVGAVAAKLELCAARSRSLGSVAKIVKGAGTNADGVFVIEDCVIEKSIVRGTTALGVAEVELAATRACVRGRDVAAFGRVDERVRCIVPYDGDRAIAWRELARRWPKTAAHLERARALLEAREKGRFTGDRFHLFGRPQNLAFHADPAPKVIVPDVARAGRAMVDDRGALVLDSAYAIRGSLDPDLIALIMGSPIVALWLQHAGVPLRGGYVRLKTAYLEPMPIPRRSRALDDATALAARGAIDEAMERLRVAYGLDEKLWGDARAESVPPRRARRA